MKKRNKRNKLFLKKGKQDKREGEKESKRKK